MENLQHVHLLAKVEVLFRLCFLDYCFDDVAFADDISDYVRQFIFGLCGFVRALRLLRLFG
jgi:hypothetical protein